MFNVPYGEQTTGDFEVVGYAVERGLEAWVIAVRGNIIRPDGGTYHLTWSLDRELGKRPYHSNALIRNEGFTAVEPIRLYAAFDFVSQ
jgi:predicted N-formylglutamate amidohydrolase